MAAYRDNHGRWRYRARIKLPTGRHVRISGSTTKQINTKEAAQQAERDHVHRLRNPSIDESQRKEVPTVNKFHEEFMDTYVKANNKPSEKMAKEYMFKHHLVPPSGTTGSTRSRRETSSGSRPTSSR